MTTTWEVQVRTGQNAWSTITIEAADHVAAGRKALKLLGGTLVSVS